MILFFLVLLVIIWLVYNYRMRQLDQELERPAFSFRTGITIKAKQNIF